MADWRSWISEVSRSTRQQRVEQTDNVTDRRATRSRRFEYIEDSDNGCQDALKCARRFRYGELSGYIKRDTQEESGIIAENCRRGNKKFNYLATLAGRNRGDQSLDQRRSVLVSVEFQSCGTRLTGSVSNLLYCIWYMQFLERSRIHSDDASKRKIQKSGSFGAVCCSKQVVIVRG